MSNVYPGPMGCHDDDESGEDLLDEIFDRIRKINAKNISTIDLKNRHLELMGKDLKVPQKAATLKCDTSSLDKYDWVENDIRNMIGWLDKYCTLNVDAERLGALWYDYFWENNDFYMKRQNDPGWVKPTADDMEDFAKWLSEQDV